MSTQNHAYSMPEKDKRELAAFWAARGVRVDDWSGPVSDEEWSAATDSMRKSYQAGAQAVQKLVRRGPPPQVDSTPAWTTSSTKFKRDMDTCSQDTLRYMNEYARMSELTLKI